MPDNDVVIQKVGINAEALDSELKAACGADYLGLSFHSAILTMHFVDGANRDNLIKAQTIGLAHDASVSTPEQEKRIAMRADIDAMRSANGTRINLVNYAALSPEIKLLAQKIAWLEVELLLLRDRAE
jgi:hypothetical protein